MSENNQASAVASFNEEIKSTIANSTATIRDAVKSKFVNEEVNRRSDLLAQLYVAINNFRKEGFKIKADIVSYNANGESIQEAWSKAQLDKRKKFDEKLSKAEAAFEKALNENEYDKIQDVIGSLKTQEGNKTQEAKSDGKSNPKDLSE